MTQKTYYVTTPIYYVNDRPHIGHAYTTLAADVMARFKRLDGYDVHFLTGTDEHGQKIQRSAEAKGVTPQQFTDEVSAVFRELATDFNFSNDDFIRTTEDRHKRACAEMWKRLLDAGHIYLDKYSGWYARMFVCAHTHACICILYTQFLNRINPKTKEDDAPHENVFVSE